MAMSGWGWCPRCKKQYTSLMMRGVCNECRDKEEKRQMFDRIATVEKLRTHPSLAELEDHLDDLYPVTGWPND